MCDVRAGIFRGAHSNLKVHINIWWMKRDPECTDSSCEELVSILRVNCLNLRERLMEKLSCNETSCHF